MGSYLFRGPMRLAQATVVVAGLLSIAACGSASGNANQGSTATGSAAGSLPAVVNVVSSNPLVGSVGAVGISANKGYELAAKEINESKFLGETKIALKTVDTGGNAQTAASQVTQAIADKSVSAIFGSVMSAEAVAQAPIAQKSKAPIIFTQAGSNGVVVGDYTYRLTPLMTAYYPIIKKFVREQNWKSLGVLYTAASPTLVAVAEQTIPAIAAELGIKITASVSTQATTQDFNAPVSNILKSNPDGVAIIQIGAANPSAMKALRQAGYKGAVVGNSGAGFKSLAPAGDDGAGMAWPVDFSSMMAGDAAKKFVESYTAAYGETPMNYAAESYDAMWFLAKSLKAAGSADRTKLQAGMDEVAAKPFTGALGENLNFKDRDLEVPGVVVQWDGTKEVFLYPASDVK